MQARGLLLLATLVGGLSDPAHAQSRPSRVRIGLEVRGGVVGSADSTLIADAMRVGLAGDSLLTVVDRPAVADPSVRWARFMAVATVSHFSATTMVQIELADTETSRDLGRATARGTGDELAAAVSDAARRLARQATPP